MSDCIAYRSGLELVFSSPSYAREVAVTLANPGYIRKSYAVLDLDAPTSKPVTSTSKKITFYVLKCLAILLCIPIKILTFVPEVISYVYNYELNEGIRKERLNSLNQALKLPLTGRGGDGHIQKKSFEKWCDYELSDICLQQLEHLGHKASELAVADFRDKVHEIHYMIVSKKDPEAIRAEIDRAMAMEIYQKLKMYEDNPLVEFLQILAVKDLSTEGEDIVQKYGRKVVGDLGHKNAFSWGELAQIMDAPAGAFFAYQRNSWRSTALWALAHPFRLLHSIESGWFPMKFNAHKGNPNFRGPDFTAMTLDGQKKLMQFYYGPGPTGDRLYNDGVLVYMDKRNRKGLPTHELRQNFQNMETRSEAMRIYEMMRYAKEHPDSMRFLSMSFDTEAMHMPKTFREFNTPADFMLLYAKYAMAEKGLADTAMTIRDIVPIAHKTVLAQREKDNGIYVGDRVVTDGRFKEAFQCGADVFSQIAGGGKNKYWQKLIGNEKGKKRLGKMMQLGTQGMIALAAVCQSLQDIGSEAAIAQMDSRLDRDLAASRVSGACKQDIDRAIVENVTLRLFFRLLTDTKPLTREEVHSIVGVVIGRARIVESRLILWNRYEVLSDLLHFVGNQENLEILAGGLRHFVRGGYAPLPVVAPAYYLPPHAHTLALTANWVPVS